MEKKPNIFICGPSGTGKSTSLRNLNPEKTFILNTERKQLPFKGALKFGKMNFFVESMEKYLKAFKAAINNDDIDVIVIESFTSLTEMVYKKAQEIYTGFDLWGYYKDKIGEILDISKNTNKWIIFLGIDQVLEGASGVEERFIAVDGSWKKKVEKEFVIVCYSHMRSGDNGKPVYEFITNKIEGFENVSAKSPMEMLPETMPNDLAELITKVESYYTE